MHIKGELFLCESREYGDKKCSYVFVGSFESFNWPECKVLKTSAAKVDTVYWCFVNYTIDILRKVFILEV